MSASSWEYKEQTGLTQSVASREEFIDSLNFWGQDGWELVAVMSGPGWMTGYMKRLIVGGASC